MIIDRSSDYITVALENGDFRMKDANGKLIWEDIVAKIKEIPGAEYNGELKLWLVLDTPTNVAVINEIYDEYFKDKNQMELF